MNYCLPLNTRMVSVEKSRDDREGQQMVFSLMPDFTYKIGPVPETEMTVKPDTPNQHTLNVLEVMRNDRRAWTVAELVEHESVGGEHRKRAIRYGLQRLEQQALIERCDPPVEKQHGRKPPVYYRACGTNVPVPFSKRGVGKTPPESVSIDQNDCTGTDSVDKADCQQIPFVNSSESSTAAGTSNTEMSQEAVDKRAVDKTGFVNSNDCTGTDEAIDGDLWVHKAIDQSRWD